MSKQKTRGPFFPTNDLLVTGATLDIWEKAKKEARRSPMIRFKVGAVLFDNNGMISSGCSNTERGTYQSCYSIHAEHHALKNAQHLDVEGAWIVIYTMNANGGCAWSSRPCFSCASLLYKRGISRVIYPYRLDDNSFILVEEHPEELLSRDIIVNSYFARGQRI